MGGAKIFIFPLPYCAPLARSNGSKVVCSASCYQLASESLVKVIASEPCSEPPMLWVTDCVEARYACEKQVQIAVRNIK